MRTERDIPGSNDPSGQLHLRYCRGSGETRSRWIRACMGAGRHCLDPFLFRPPGKSRGFAQRIRIEQLASEHDEAGLAQIAQAL